MEMVEVTKEIPLCPDCKSKYILTIETLQNFSALVDNEKIPVSVSVPKHTCTGCGLVYYTNETEMLRMIAVNEAVSLFKKEKENK